MSKLSKTLFVLVAATLILVLSVLPSKAETITWSNIGPSSLWSVSIIAVDPRPPSTLYIYARHQSTGEFSMLKTSDGGANWSPVAFPWGTLHALVVDPTVADTIYAAGSFAGYAKIYKSTDKGEHWSRIDAGIPSNLDVLTFVIDAQTPNTFYIGTNSSLTEVYKSTDGGNSWKPLGKIDNVTGSVYVNALAIHPGNAATIYAATQHGVYRTTNGGLQWAKKINGFIDTGTTSLLVDPWNSSKLYAGMGDTGIFISTDGANQWTQKSNGLPSAPSRVMALVAPPRPAAPVYAVLIYHGLFASTDGGNHWDSIAVPSQAQSVALKTSAPNMLYVGTPNGVFAAGMDWSWSWPYSTYLPVLRRP